jgi:hypothetical protein
VLGTNVPDHADLVLTHRRHQYQTVISHVTNIVEQLSVIVPVWQEDLAYPAYGPVLSLGAVSRWDVTNGFQMVWPLE